MTKYYTVTRTCKDDLREIFRDNPEILDHIDNLSDDAMELFARKLEEDYTTQLYWQSAETIYKQLFIGEKTK